MINLEHVEPHIQDPGLESEIPRKPITKDIPTILNLSKKDLTKEEKEVVSLGLKFAPEYFDRYYEQCQKSYNKLINKPSTSPLPNLIDEHLVVIKENLQATVPPGSKQTKPQWLNLSTIHKRTLFALRGDKSRTIKPADKGSCIVVQDTTDYIKEGKEFLSDKKTYEKLDSDISHQTAEKAKQLLDKFYEEGLLDKYTLDNSTTDMDCLRPQRLYSLRKVHKTPHQLRPIVSCCSGPTQKIVQTCQ